VLAGIGTGEVSREEAEAKEYRERDARVVRKREDRILNVFKKSVGIGSVVTGRKVGGKRKSAPDERF